MTNIILVLIFLLFVFLIPVLSRSPSHKGAHCSWQNFNLVEIESRCGSAVSSRGGAGLLSLRGLLVSVGPVPHAWLHWVMSSSVLAVFFFTLFVFVYLFLGDSFAPSAHLVHQPGSHSFGQPFTSLARFPTISLTVDSLHRKHLLQPLGLLCTSSPKSLFRRNEKLRSQLDQLDFYVFQSFF